jgi:hypothetical protein
MRTTTRKIMRKITRMCDDVITVQPQKRSCYGRDGAHRSLDMKKLAIAFVLAALVASPALARQRHAISSEAAAAQAYAPYAPASSVIDRNTVIVNGRIVGRDPDSYVRLMLMRDPMGDGT